MTKNKVLSSFAVSEAMRTSTEAFKDEFEAHIEEHGPESINTPDGLGNTLLHKAAMYGTPEIIDFLIELGADKNSMNSHDETPKTMAARLEHKDQYKAVSGKELDEETVIEAREAQKAAIRIRAEAQKTNASMGRW